MALNGRWKKSPSGSRRRIGVRRLARTRNASNRRLKLTAILLETKPASLIQVPPPQLVFWTKTSSTKRRHLNVLPCWGPMQKDSRDSFRSACANRATQIGGIVKQNKWQSGAMQRHGRLSLSLVPIQAFSGYTRRDSWTATLHARHVEAPENLRKKESRGSARNHEGFLDIEFCEGASLFSPFQYSRVSNLYSAIVLFFNSLLQGSVLVLTATRLSTRSHLAGLPIVLDRWRPPLFLFFDSVQSLLFDTPLLHKRLAVLLFLFISENIYCHILRSSNFGPTKSNSRRSCLRFRIPST